MRNVRQMNLGVENVEFMQADILELRKLGRKFDIVECGGVLHHMDDPLKGWSVLVDILKPNGFMKIGLYSEHARKHIVAARSFIKGRGYRPTLEGIQECRQAILALPDEDIVKKVSIEKIFIPLQI